MRALISVYDKTGVEDLARGLADLGWDLVSSGGTAAALREAGLRVADTEELTGFPAILGHRVVTLHPKVHGGILADRHNPHHVAELEQYGIDAIDLVVGNLYPFGADEKEFAHGATPEDLIDIGGPTLVRAAAKNHTHVGVVVNPADYDGVLAEIREHGELTAETRRRLAATPSPTLRPTTRPSPPGSTARPTTRCPRACTSPPPARTARCATARTRTSRPPSTASTAPNRGGRRRPSTAGSP